MRFTLVWILSLFLLACGGGSPQQTTTGPVLHASLAATWPASGPARRTAFSRDGRLLAASDASGLITLRNTRDWSIVEQLRHPGGATSVAFSADGARLFSGGYDGTVREWNLARHALVGKFDGARGTVWTVDVSPDGHGLAAAGEDATIRIWPLDRRAPPTALHGHTRNIWDVRFSPDSQRIASGSFDATARLWDARSGRQLRQLSGHTQAIVGLAFSPDGRSLATGADDSTIRVWRVADGRPLRTIRNGTHVDAVAFSPNGKWLASGGHPRGAGGALWRQLTGGGGQGPAVRIWRSSDGALVAVLPHPDDVTSVVFSPDGRWLVTSGEDSRFRLWRIQEN